MAAKYEPAFDGLRAVAIAAVMGFHFRPGVVTGGSLGVDVFFPLSGWLITSLLLKEAEATGGVDYRSFLSRRIGRLMPPLLVMLAAYGLLAPCLVPRAAAWRWTDIAWAATCLTNIKETFWPRGSPLNHTWFLGLQVQFYLVWPVVVLALRPLGRPRAAVALLGLWLALSVGRMIWDQTTGGPGAYYLTPWHATGLVLGSALAFNPMKAPDWAGWLALAVLLALFGLGQTRTNPFATFAFSQPLAEWATVILLTAPPTLLSAAPLPFLGRISYGIYLWHVPFMWAVSPRTWPGLAFLIVASIAAGWLSYRLIDKPLARVRKRSEPATSTA